MAILIASIHTGLGQHSSALPPAMVAEFKHLSMLSAPLHLAEITVLKLGIVCMYMRANFLVHVSRTPARSMCRQQQQQQVSSPVPSRAVTNRGWTYFLHIAFAATLLIGAAEMMLHVADCVPLRFMGVPSAVNERSGFAYCRTTASVKFATLVISVLTVLSDVQLAMLPGILLFYGLGRRNKVCQLRNRTPAHDGDGTVARQTYDGLPRSVFANMPYTSSGEEYALLTLLVLGWICTITSACRLILFSELFTSNDVTWVSTPWRFGGFAHNCIGAIGANGAVVVLWLGKWRVGRRERVEGIRRRITRLRRERNGRGLEAGDTVELLGGRVDIDGYEKTPAFTYNMAITTTTTTTTRDHPIPASRNPAPNVTPDNAAHAPTVPVAAHLSADQKTFDPESNLES
jgi:hypothetical protein